MGKINGKNVLQVVRTVETGSGGDGAILLVDENDITELNPALISFTGSDISVQFGEIVQEYNNMVYVYNDPTGNIVGVYLITNATIDKGETTYEANLIGLIPSSPALYRNRVVLGGVTWTYSSEYRTGHVTLDIICDTEIKNMADFTSYMNSLTSYKTIFGVLTSSSYSTYPIYISKIAKATTNNKMKLFGVGMAGGNKSDFEFDDIDYANATSTAFDSNLL